MEQRFKQTIQINDKNIADIFRLPCVRSIWKGVDVAFEVELDLDSLSQKSTGFIAHLSDWLCQCYDATWCILADKEYKEIEYENA